MKYGGRLAAATASPADMRGGGGGEPREGRRTKMMMKIGGGGLRPTEEKRVYIYIYILKWFRVSYRENHH